MFQQTPQSRSRFYNIILNHTRADTC